MCLDNACNISNEEEFDEVMNECAPTPDQEAEMACANNC